MAGPFTATVEVAGPFKIEGKAYTIAAKSKPSGTTSPIVAAAEKPVKSRYGTVIIIIGMIALAAAGMAIYKKNATV
ncbi:MAG: hypothetical protein WBC05_05845 [Sedimentisphaerales bacterium]